MEFKVPIYFPKENKYRLLSDVSPVIESLAKKQFDDYVKRVRIFASPDIRHQLLESTDFESALRTAVETTAS